MLAVILMMSDENLGNQYLGDINEDRQKLIIANVQQYQNRGQHFQIYKPRYGITKREVKQRRP